MKREGSGMECGSLAAAAAAARIDRSLGEKRRDIQRRIRLCSGAPVRLRLLWG